MDGQEVQSMRTKEYKYKITFQDGETITDYFTEYEAQAIADLYNGTLEQITE